MQAIASKHPPGLIIFLSGELFRFTAAAQCITQLVAPTGTKASWQTGVLISKLLNTGIASALSDPKMQWVWIMGDDHVFRPDVLTRLLDHEVDVVAPFCLNRMPPMDSLIAVWNKMDGAITTNDFRMKFLEEMPSTGLYRLAPNETCGDAGLLIRRPVLEATGQIGGEMWYDTRNSGGWASDDQAFTRKIKERGFDIYIDCDTEIGHIQPMAVVPRRVNHEKYPWGIRLIAGTKTVVDFIPERTDKYKGGR